MTSCANDDKVLGFDEELLLEEKQISEQEVEEETRQDKMHHLVEFLFEWNQQTFQDTFGQVPVDIWALISDFAVPRVSFVLTRIRNGSWREIAIFLIEKFFLHGRNVVLTPT